MVAWGEIEADAPEFAARVRELFQARKHKTMATLRADGSPRISGIETQIGEQLTFGSMPLIRASSRTCNEIHGSRCTARRSTRLRTTPARGPARRRSADAPCRPRTASGSTSPKWR